MSVGIDGSIHGIEVGDLMETAGIGTKVAEAPFLGQYEALAADPTVIDSEVDITAGVTVTMVPFKQATMQMTALTKEALGIAPNPGTPGAQALTGDDLLRQRQLPEALRFAEVSPYALVGDFAAIRQIYRGVAGRQTVGYTFELAPMGFEAPVVFRTSIDAGTGTVAAVDLIEQNDTPGFGTRLEGEEGAAFFAQFVGKPAEDPLGDVDVIGGVTVTSGAVKKGVAQAAAFYAQYLVPGAGPTDPDEGVTFEDIDLPTPDDYRAVQSAQRGVKDGAVVCYRFVVRVSGYDVDYGDGRPILMQVDVDAAGNYLSLMAIENPETPGFGNKSFEEPFIGQFIGKPATAETMDEVQTVSGATITSDAVMRGLRQVARAHRSILDAGEDAAAGDNADEGIEFEDIDLPTPEEYRVVRSAQRGLKDGAVVRYRFVARVSGYAADNYDDGQPILMQVDVDAAGNFLSLVAIENPETPGFGNKLFEEPFIGQFIGKPAADETVDGIQAVSGATVTSDAVMRGLRQVARAHRSILAAAGAEDVVSGATSHDESTSHDE